MTNIIDFIFGRKYQLRIIRTEGKPSTYRLQRLYFGIPRTIGIYTDAVEAIDAWFGTIE